MKMTKDQLKEFYQLIDSQDWDSLIQLKIRNHNDDIFAEFKKPFKNVQFFSLDGFFKKIKPYSVVYVWRAISLSAQFGFVPVYKRSRLECIRFKIIAFEKILNH